MTSSPPIPTAPHAEYRRRARRIRSVFAAPPVVRMRALSELAREQDRVRREAPPAGPVTTLPEGRAGRFAELVRERMDGPVLRYSHRAVMIRDAARHGVGRFEANLIIAAVQHQSRTTRSMSATPRDAGAAGAAWTPAIAAVATTQSLIAAAVWWVVG